MSSWVWDNSGFLLVVLAVNGVVALAMVLAALIELPLVRRRGGRIADIYVQRAGTNLKRFALLFVGVQFVLGVLYFSLAAEVDRDHYMLVVFVPTFLISYSVFLFYRRPLYNQLKEAIEEMGADILVDLNHRLLNTILNWRLEAASMVALMASSALYFDWDSSAFMISPMLMMIYFSVRRRKYFVRGEFGCWYKSMLVGNLFLQSFKGVVMIKEVARIDVQALSSLDQLVLGATAALVAAQWLRSFARAPAAYREIRESMGPSDPAPSPV